MFGAVNAALLWYGDVLGAWGLLGLLVVWLFLRRSNKTLIVWASVLLGLLALMSLSSLAAGIFVPAEYLESETFAFPQPAAEQDYLASIGARLLLWVPLSIGQAVLQFVAPIVVFVAIVCARRGILEAPQEHRPLLVRTAVLGITLGWLGAVPALLATHELWAVPTWAPALLHGTTGMFAALGYAAVFALIVSRYTGSRPPAGAVLPLTALGKRSLSGYLWQSAVFAPLLCAWGLGLGAILDQWQAAIIAVATWVVSVMVAMSLDRAGRRGPAEWLLRRLVYRRAGTPATPITYDRV